MFKKKKKEDGEAKPEEGKEEGKEAAKEAPKEGEAAAEGTEGEAAPKKGKKKLIIIVAAAVLLLGGGGAAFMLMSGGEKKEEHAAEGGEHGEAGHEEAAAEEESGGHGGGHGDEKGKVAGAPVYYELPEFLVNLSTNTGRTSFLKMHVTLELKNDAATAVIEAHKPRILDTFNTYLRELRPSDVQGSAGIYRLRDELMTRINGTVQEGLVKDILFSEIIVQ
jgi:flagellar FliL protein